MKKSILISIVLSILLISLYVFFNKTKEAKIVVSGPSQFTVGELIELDASKSIAQNLQWKILPETKNFKTVDRKAFFSSQIALQHTIIITAAYQGTLETSILTLNPKSKNIEIPEKLKELMDGGIIKTKDDFILTAKQLGIEVKEQWIEENFSQPQLP